MSNRVSPEQIACAKEIDILDYLLANEPNNLKKSGNEYHLRDHDSLRISNGLWMWESRGVGGKNVIDYLMKVRGYDFVNAVRCLVGEDNSPPPSPQRKAKPPPERKPFALPPRNGSNDRVIAYLQSRGIDRSIIEDCIRRGALYETATWHNCCFVGRDERGKARFAAMRATVGDFKRDADSSDKRYGFCMSPDNPNCNAVIVFESPIDLLSYDTLCKLGFIEHQDAWRLSLGCTALTALLQFLKTHPEISHITVCTDNDGAGSTAAVKVKELLIAEELTHISCSRSIPEVGKDWNESLQIIRKEVNPLEDVRKDILFLKEPFTYPEAFRIKDGDSVKVTYFDGEEATAKCRYIDEVQFYLGNNVCMLI